MRVQVCEQNYADTAQLKYQTKIKEHSQFVSCAGYK